MSPEHIKLLRAQIIASVPFNFALNGAIAWWIFGPLPIVPIWGRQQSVAGDTIGTSFFLPLITCLILTPIVRRAMRSGSAQPLPWSRAMHPWLFRLPANMVLRGMTLGLFCAVIIGPPTLLLASTIVGASMTGTGVAIFKAVYTALLSAVVTPVITLRALAGDRVDLASQATPSPNAGLN